MILIIQFGMIALDTSLPTDRLQNLRTSQVERKIGRQWFPTERIDGKTNSSPPATWVNGLEPGERFTCGLTNIWKLNYRPYASQRSIGYLGYIPVCLHDTGLSETMVHNSIHVAGPSLCPLKLFKNAIWGYSQLLDKPIYGYFPSGNRSHSYGNPVCLIWVCTYITYKRAIYTIAMLDYQRVITMLAYTGLYYHSNSFSSLKEVLVICRFGWCPAKWTDMQDLVGINVSEVGWNNFNFTRYGWWQSEVLWAETQLITGDLVTGIRSVFAWDSSCIHLVESSLLNT